MTLPQFPVALAAVALAVPAAVPAQNNDVAAIQRHLRAITTLTADFSQTDRLGKVLTGTLTWRQPGRIRFQYQKGVPLLVVADGGALTFVDYDVKQVQRYPIKDSPLGVLLDPSRDIGRYARLVTTGNDQVVSAEASDRKHPEWGRINLVFARAAAAPGGLQLQGWVMIDSQNNRTTIRLSNHRYGAPVSDNQFKFNDPRRANPHR